MEMKYLGVYEKKYQKSGMLRIPKQWVEQDKKQLYCALCQDMDLEISFLRFYDEKEALMQFKKETQEDGPILILQCYRVKQIPVWKGMILPKEFCEISVSHDKKELSCVGIGNGFEIWYSEDLKKMETCFDDIFDDLSSF